MALTPDAISSPASSLTTTGSWTHTPSHTPVGVILILLSSGWTGANWQLATVTYGGVTMTNASGKQGSVNPGGVADNFYLDGNSAIPSGPQTVQVTYVGGDTTTKHATCLTVYATAGETAVYDSGNGTGSGIAVTAQYISVAHSGTLTNWLGFGGVWSNAVASTAGLQTGDHSEGSGFNFGASSTAPSANYMMTSVADGGAASSSLYGYASNTSATYAAVAVVLRGIDPPARVPGRMPLGV